MPNRCFPFVGSFCRKKFGKSVKFSSYVLGDVGLGLATPENAGNLGMEPFESCRCNIVDPVLMVGFRHGPALVAFLE